MVLLYKVLVYQKRYHAIIINQECVVVGVAIYLGTYVIDSRTFVGIKGEERLLHFIYQDILFWYFSVYGVNITFRKIF